ncbi:PREDICTED: putative F-box protein At4g09190 [Camelina sativa]|uniref:F-box protein At4g09190 n=1 Tax=Camelina sativa TaxID=90675 RepID=A0ABM0WAP5_CAMSA|nr:PREDICTED: putative F-box protein At4g09190 [Camelina sativa]
MHSLETETVAEQGKVRKRSNCGAIKDEKIQRTIQSSEHIPLDLIVEIFSRLPAKSIVRLSSVSRLWSSITTTPGFINSVVTQYLSSRHCVMLIFRKNDKLFFFASPLHTGPKVESFQFTIPNNDNIRRYESVHGLIYLETSRHVMFIRNPIMKSFFTLPKLDCNQGSPLAGFLGYDPINGRHKVLCILMEENKIGIFTLGAQESWRILTKGFPSHYYVTGFARCIDGVIYYEGSFGCPVSSVRAIMSFDLKSETFILIKHPKKYDKNTFWASFEGRLALVSSTPSGVELWILEDRKNHNQWIYKHFPSPHDFNKEKWKLMGVTETGEFIYTSSRASKLTILDRVLYEWFRIMYVDPKRNSMREVMYGGIIEDDIRRLDKVGYDRMKDLTVISYHIEI